MKLYTHVINYSMFMLVSHRDILSIYDMRPSQKHINGKWLHSIQFKSGFVRRMYLKKRPKEE